MSKESRNTSILTVVVAAWLLNACGNGSSAGGHGTGGGRGGDSVGSLATGGGGETGGTIGGGGQKNAAGASAGGGSLGTSPATTSGSGTGGSATGGSTTGGSTIGGSTTGGSATGGSTTGGSTNTGGGAPSGGSRFDGGLDAVTSGSDLAGGMGVGGTTGAARTITNIYFTGKTSPSQALDLLLPGNARLPLPLIIRFHGGGFSGGQKEPEETGTAANAILAKGYALASVNYRLSGEAPFPAGVADAKAAARWLRAHAAEYGLDTARFASWGESAGAYLAVALGVTGDRVTVFDDDALGNPGVSSAVAAVIDWYGPTDLATMDSQQTAHPPMSCASTWLQHTPASSPEGTWLGGALNTAAVSTKLMQANLPAYIAAAQTLPTFFIAHGDNDCQVPWGQSQELKDALAKVGNTATLTILAGASHADGRFESTQSTPALTLLGTVFGR